MSDSSDVPQTAYAVALRLAEIIALGEGRQLRMANTAAAGVDRAYVLGLYRECLEAVGSQGMAFTPRG